MEYRKLTRMFGQVKLPPEREDAILAELLSEKKEVFSMKEYKKNKIPAALVAAVLVVVLAGTALAVEYLGRINIELQGEWYGAHMDGGRVPADSLSEDIWAASDSADERGDAYFIFESRLEAETFLGLDLSDNALLEKMPIGELYYRGIQCPCVMFVQYTSGQIPAIVTVSSSYTDRGSACYVSEYIEFRTDAASDEFEPGVRSRMMGEGDFQMYVTSNGIEATIYSETDTAIHSAYFAKNNVFYSIKVYNSDLDTLIEVLDAYE